MLNIAFYHKQFVGNGNQMHVATSALYLKHYIDTHKPEIAAQLHWEIPVQGSLTDQELIDFCYDNKVDVLCISLFVWNEIYFAQQMSRVRDQLPESITVIAGGPSVSVHSERDWLDQRPWIDYAVYGAGEQAFSDVIEALITHKKLIRFNTSNVAWRDPDQQRVLVADYRVVPEPKVSPYLHCEDLLRDMVEQQQARGISVIMPWQLTRGCPYSCTFCDWNNGLDRKVSRRKGTFRDEIELFYQLGVQQIFITDANFGQYDEDIEIFEYLADVNLERRAGFEITATYSKLRKNNVQKLHHVMGRGKMAHAYVGFAFSVQDLDPQVLINIDRPDVSWQVHRQMIQELQHDYPEVPCSINMIVGLPGQSFASWQRTLIETMNQHCVLLISVNELLPMSPAALDPDYATRFSMKHSTALRWNGHAWQTSAFAESCYSFTQEEMVAMTVLTAFWHALSRARWEIGCDVDSEHLMQQVITSEPFQKLCADLYSNWTENKCFYYRIDLYGHAAPEGKLTACYFAHFDLAWSVHPVILRMLMNSACDLRTDYKKFMMYMKQHSTSLSDPRPRLENTARILALPRPQITENT
jgi:radical SAM superfamily enzyme YgiQ (UPF0313 family)